jgi:hypothetical protein
VAANLNPLSFRSARKGRTSASQLRRALTRLREITDPY